MPGKRQHYVPRFLLRRFSIDPANKKSLLYRLDKKSGRNGQVNATNEAVVGHYYRIDDASSDVGNLADELLDRTETMAADVIPKLADPAYRITHDDVLRLLMFVVLLKQRTPQGREALREVDERAGELWLEMTASDRECYHRVMREQGGTEEEIEAHRQESLNDIRAGRICVESSADREIALMFVGFEKSLQTLFEQCGLVLLRAPAGGKSAFVLSDNPVAHYDPTPKMPGAGVSFMSSPNSATLVPLDPGFALLLVQGVPQMWRAIEVSAGDVDEANLLTYAWAREAIYGPTQEAVTRVRRLARRNPAQMGRFAYRPPRVWVTDDHDASSERGPRTFTSRFKGQELERTL